MQCKAGGFAHSCYEKRWNPHFTARRVFKGNTNKPIIEHKRKELGEKRSDLEVFFLESVSPGSLWKLKEIKRLFRAMDPDNLMQAKGIVGCRKAAWVVDEGSFAQGITGGDLGNECKDKLSANELLQRLKMPLFGHEDGNIPDPERRFIFITNLDLSFILALALTAPPHQEKALRDAIWKYLKRETSLRVNIPTRGYSSFQLELALPYFRLRPLSSKECLNPLRKSRNLSFLKIQDPESEDQEDCEIHEAQFSLTICGLDDFRWVRYGFADSDSEEEDTEYEDTDDKEEDGEEGVGKGVNFLDDPIALDGLIDACHPVENPRECFLIVFEIRSHEALNEWQYVVRTLERSINQCRSQHSYTLSWQSRTTAKRQDVKETYDWTMKTIDLLSDLIAVLSKVIIEWESFNASDGDIVYFSDLESFPEGSRAPVRRSLGAIKGTFKELEKLREDLLVLEKSCLNDAEALKLWLNVEGNETAKHTGTTAEFTVLFVSPLTLVTSFFSMNRPIMPFQLNVWTFMIALIVMMMILRLAYFIINWLLPRLRWWKKIHGLIKNQKRNEITDTPSTRQVEHVTRSTSVEMERVGSFPWSSIKVGDLRPRIQWERKKEGVQVKTQEMELV